MPRSCVRTAVVLQQWSVVLLLQWAMLQPCRGRAARPPSHSPTLEIDALRARASCGYGKVVQSTRTGGGGAYHSRRTRARAYGRVREVPPTGRRADRPSD